MTTRLREFLIHVALIVVLVGGAGCFVAMKRGWL